MWVVSFREIRRQKRSQKWCPYVCASAAASCKVLWFTLRAALCDLRLFMMREHLLSNLTTSIKVRLSLIEIKNSAIYDEFHRCDYSVRTDEDDGSRAIHYDDSSCCMIRKSDHQVRYLWRQCEPCAILIRWTTILIAQPCHSSTISILIYE